MHKHSAAPQQANQAQPATVAFFVSDVHLNPVLPRTTAAFLDFLYRHATHAEQLYLLGDLFEYWAGDDDLDEPYNRSIVDALRAIHDEGVKIFWIAGNRDFLVGDSFARASGLTLLSDPCVVSIAGRRIVLLHGDAQCTDDYAYMQFRTQVRQPQWQQEFLTLPLARRKAIIADLRTGSREAQSNKAYEIMDVNDAAIMNVFENFSAQLMIHGHTHRPAIHQHEQNGRKYVRHVLPDWDCDTAKVRGGWITLHSDGELVRHDFAALAE